MSTSRGGLMVCGATSNAGKSTVTAALCRSWSRQGLSVAPFKAQNMSNHAAVTANGGEVGRAQAMQASAAGVALDRRMNPILLKPSSATGSHLVVLGDEISTTDATSYGPTTEKLKPVVLKALQGLQADHDWIVAEGAGGAAEINLLERDLVNLPLARAAGLPAVLVVDIDLGGAFAAAHGTIDLLPDALRSPLAGIIFNKFRGDTNLLTDGIRQLEERDGLPVLGVLPYIEEHTALGAEDSLDVLPTAHSPTRSEKPVRVAVVRFPRLANPSDFDPFIVEPDVELRWVTRPDELTNADLIVLPGSRATVADLEWLRATKIDRALQKTEAWVVGICAGYQMLGTRIDDTVESQAGIVNGLGLLDAETTFREPKIVRRSHGTTEHFSVTGYQIRFGRPTSSAAPWFQLDGSDEGAVSASGAVRGSSLHGLFDADEFRTHLLSAVADTRGRTYNPAEVGFATELERQHDRLADWLEAHLDTDRLRQIAGTSSHPEAAPGW